MTDVSIQKTETLNGEVYAPASKSYTQRMVIAASLSSETSKISCPLLADDTDMTLRAVQALGAKVNISKDYWTVTGTSSLKRSKTPIDCGKSGATLRFMIPIAALADGTSILLFRESLEKRPIEPLLHSLEELGVSTSTGTINDKSFVKVNGGGIRGGKTRIRGDISSQFISGLMFACPRAQQDTEIEVTTSLESKSYIEMTRNVLNKHDINVFISDDFRQIHIPSNQTYKACDHCVPGDFSSAAFLLAAAAITNSNVTVRNLDYSLVQGDKVIVTILKQMGVNGKVCPDNVKIEGTGRLLKATDLDAKDTPDLVPVCASLACYAKNTTRIRNARRLKLKESDRLQSLYLELTKMGADIEVTEDSLLVKGACQLHGAEIDPHNDHRIAMACAVAAIGADDETIIHNAECVRKSYPTFFLDLKQLGVNVIGGKFDR